MSKIILVSVDHEETRAALLENNRLAELWIERPVNQRVAGNIYKGKVENVLPGMQAAFVNIGLERNSFLYVDDAMPGREDDDEFADLKHLTIKDVLKEGQEVMVQVAKEPIGTKGARVTRHITLPGRYLVLMPSVDYIGISRRISDEAERERLRELAQKVRPPGVGLIVRTVAEGASEEDLRRDAEFLHHLWTKVQERRRTAEAPALLHKDLGLVYRIIRDVLTEEIDQLVIDSRSEYERALELLGFSSPQLTDRVSFYNRRDKTLFEAHGVESEIEKALKKRVWLKSGGYLVIDHAEALTVIDVNTGKFVGTTNLADTVFKTNLEAAAEIARQIRLRDIGGIIIVDFIDMEVAEHRQKVLKALEEATRQDRTKVTVLGLTQLGLVEMTRKKVRQSIDEVLQRPCPYCEGRGKVLSEDTMSRRVRNEIRKILRGTPAEACLIELHPSVAALVIGTGGANLKQLEQELGKTIYVRGSHERHIESVHVAAIGSRAEVEAKALPVHSGEEIDVKIEEPHVTNPADGIARIDGYVVNVVGAGDRVGQRVRVKIVRAFRTYAKARLLVDNSRAEC